MKNLMLGAALGVAIGYLARKMQEEGILDQMSDELDKLSSKTKNKFNHAVDKGKNKARHMKNRAQKIEANAEDLLKQ